MAPAVVIRPIFGGLAANSVNHSAPSGPAVISSGPLGFVGSGYSVIVPPVVIRPILWPFSSVNHRAPSGPTVIPAGRLTGVGTGNSVTAAAGAGNAASASTTANNVCFLHFLASMPLAPSRPTLVGGTLAPGAPGSTLGTRVKDRRRGSSAPSHVRSRPSHGSRAS